MRLKTFSVLAGIGAAISLSACGDDITEVTVIHQNAVYPFNESNDESVCNDSTIGNLNYDNGLHVCNGNQWVSLKGENGIDGKDGKNGTDGKDGSYCETTPIVNGYKILCDGDSIGVIKHGQNGANGLTGDNGANGTACITTPTSSGYDIVCDGSVVGSISNGSTGEKGDKGISGDKGPVGDQGATGDKGDSGNDGSYCSSIENETGYSLVCNGTNVGSIANGIKGSAGDKGETATGCTFKENSDGSYTQTCGTKTSIIYAAICGTETYNPAGNKFCLGVKLYDKCGTTEYDPSIEFCSGTTLYNLCGGKTYTPSTQACCNTTVYTSSTQFCSSNAVYNKCGTATYTPSTQFCSNSKVYDKCGSSTYDPTTKFCSGTTLYNLCGGKTYTPSTQACCNTTVYTSSTQFCSSNVVYNKCGTATYTPSTQFCDSRDSKIYKYIKIGTQTWMAQNLNYAYNVGSAKSYCYSGSSSNCSTYGRLYKWSAAMDSAKTKCGDGKTCSFSTPLQGVCPSGWHLPTKAEWTTLINKTGGESSAGKALKSTSGWGVETSWLKGNGTDSYGFKALPAGRRSYDSNGNYFDLKDDAYFWSASESSKSDASNINIANSYDKAYYETSSKGYYFSVRCIKN